MGSQDTVLKSVNHPATASPYMPMWIYERRIRSWTVTGFYSTRPRDDLPTNPYQDHVYRLDQPIPVDWVTVSSTGVVSHSYGGDYTPDTAYSYFYGRKELVLGSMDPLSVVTNREVLKALTKVADAKVNLAVALAEASKTSDLILGTANRLYQAYRGFRRGNFQEVARNLNITPRRLHKSWLEYKYGWMPLISDVKGAAEFLAQQHLGRPLRFSVNSRGDESRTLEVKEMLSGYAPGSHYLHFCMVKRKCRVKLKCEVTNPHFSALQQLGLTNPALIAWELIPFSFVFDWFLSVGDWLKGLTALHGVAVRDAMFSRLEETTVWRKLTIYPRTLPSGTKELGMYHELNATSRYYNREGIIVDPLSLYPPVGDPFNWNRLITGVALLRAQARSLD